MTGKIPEKWANRIENIPTSLQYSMSNKSLKYAELLSAIDLMGKEKCIKIHFDEFHREFGKNGIVGLRQNASKTGFPYILRIVEDKQNQNYIIFKNDKLPKKAAA
jgi:hypothetical protein